MMGNKEKDVSAEHLVTECAKILCDNQTGDIEHALNLVLEMTGRFCKADCVYLFQKENLSLADICEWRLDSHSWKERIDAYLPFFLRHWNHYFVSDSYVKIDCAEDIRAERPEAYEMLKKLNISSVFVLPLRLGGDLMGLVGMENYNVKETSDIFTMMSSMACLLAYALRVSSLTGTSL